MISEILPGALTLALLLLDYLRSNPDPLKYLLSQGTAALVAGSGAFLILSWILGTFFDAIRNLFEHLWDRIGRARTGEGLDWDFFFKGEREKVFQLEEHYFAYYILNTNYVIGIILFGLAKFFLSYLSPSHYVLLLTLCPFLVLVYVADAFLLRKEMKALLKKEDATILPHEGAYTRLRPSTLRPPKKDGDSVSSRPPEPGVGVFAIRKIPKGTNVFAGDDNEMVELDIGLLEKLDPAERCLYEDFCVFEGRKMWCPRNFNNLTVGWYLNHSEDPNVRHDKGYNFLAIRDIEKGEELTANYSTYSDLPPGRRSFTDPCVE